MSTKLGDISNGLISLGDDARLLDAITELKAEGPHTDKSQADRQKHLATVLDFVEQAVLSEAGRKTFPQWAQQLQQERNRLPVPSGPDALAQPHDCQAAE